MASFFQSSTDKNFILGESGSLPQATFGLGSSSKLHTAMQNLTHHHRQSEGIEFDTYLHVTQWCIFHICVHTQLSTSFVASKHKPHKKWLQKDLLVLFNVHRCTFFQEEHIGVAVMEMTKITSLCQGDDKNHTMNQMEKRNHPHANERTTSTTSLHNLVHLQNCFWDGPWTTIQTIPKNPMYTNFDYLSLEFLENFHHQN